MAVRRPFTLSLYGVSGVLIEYSAHNCRYFDFRPSDTLILAIFKPNRIKYNVTRNLGNLKNITFLFFFFERNILRPKSASQDECIRFYNIFLIYFRGLAKNA